MINIERPDEAPESLKQPDIQAFLDEMQAHLDAVRIGASLAKPTAPVTYRSSDLVKKFESVFHSKCWLTEMKFETGADLEVDHFVPKGENELLRYNWANLFPVDSKTNKIRPKSTPTGGYLDPCNSNDDVEKEIAYLLLAGESAIRFEASDPTNLKALNTARLLDRVHNGHDPVTKESTEGLRRLIFKREREILETFLKYFQATDHSQEKRLLGATLKYFFSREAAFTMLLRNSDTGIRLQEFHQD